MFKIVKKKKKKPFSVLEACSPASAWVYSSLLPHSTGNVHYADCQLERRSWCECLQMNVSLSMWPSIELVGVGPTNRATLRAEKRDRLRNKTFLIAPIQNWTALYNWVNLLNCQGDEALNASLNLTLLNTWVGVWFPVRLTLQRSPPTMFAQFNCLRLGKTARSGNCCVFL